MGSFSKKALPIIESFNRAGKSLCKVGMHVGLGASTAVVGATVGMTLAFGTSSSAFIWPLTFLGASAGVMRSIMTKNDYSERSGLSLLGVPVVGVGLAVGAMAYPAIAAAVAAGGVAFAASSLYLKFRNSLSSKPTETVTPHLSPTKEATGPRRIRRPSSRLRGPSSLHK